MENNNSLIVLVLMVAFYIFSFVFSLQSLLVTPPNALYMSLAFIGYVLSLVIGLMMAITILNEGSGLAMGYFVFVGAVAVTLIWYSTRIGNIYGFL